MYVRGGSDDELDKGEQVCRADGQCHIVQLLEPTMWFRYFEYVGGWFTFHYMSSWQQGMQLYA